MIDIESWSLPISTEIINQIYLAVLQSHNKAITDVCGISMYVSDMGKYAEFNKLYCETINHVNPPSRACVQVPLPDNCPIIIEAVAWSASNVATGDSCVDR